MTGKLNLALRSLRVRNYRLYFLGQVVSVSGNWMQQIAIAWLVLGLTGSVFQLGVTTALQTVPFLLLGAWGGLLADRLPKRRLLIVTQTLQVIPPVALWILTQSGSVRIWMIYVIVVLRGLVNTVDNPARQSFVAEIVDRDQLVNAVSLNASIVQAGRLVGPAVAALVIATLGLGPCFLLNALTFVFMIAMLLAMNGSELHPEPPAPRAKGQLRAGLAVVARTPDLRLPLALMAVVGLFSFNFTVVLPAVARFTYGGTATTYAVMVNFLALGALGGALVSSVRTSIGARVVSFAAIAFGGALCLTAAAPDLRLALPALVLVGATSVLFSASVQASLQLAAAPEMRGRILALYQIVYMGTTPLGAILVGALAATLGARSGLVLGGDRGDARRARGHLVLDVEPAHPPDAADLCGATLTDRLIELLDGGGNDRLAVVSAESGDSRTYRELRETATALAGALSGIGVGRGSRVALVLPDGPDFLLAPARPRLARRDGRTAQPRLQARRVRVLPRRPPARAPARPGRRPAGGARGGRRASAAWSTSPPARRPGLAVDGGDDRAAGAVRAGASPTTSRCCCTRAARRAGRSRCRCGSATSWPRRGRSPAFYELGAGRCLVLRDAALPRARARRLDVRRARRRRDRRRAAALHAPRPFWPQLRAHTA